MDDEPFESPFDKKRRVYKNRLSQKLENAIAAPMPIVISNANVDNAMMAEAPQKNLVVETVRPSYFGPEQASTRQMIAGILGERKRKVDGVISGGVAAGFDSMGMVPIGNFFRASQNEANLFDSYAGKYKKGKPTRGIESLKNLVTNVGQPALIEYQNQQQVLQAETNLRRHRADVARLQDGYTGSQHLYRLRGEDSVVPYRPPTSALIPMDMS